MDGPLDGILVGGDIAWSGQPEQFDDARRWLTDLTEICGCPLSQGMDADPGNHDVDWAFADGDISMHFRQELRECADQEIDGALRRRLVTDRLGDVLIRPLLHYNTFAKDWGCQTTAAQPEWTDAVLQVDGQTLRFCGLNSALTSDREDSKDEGTRRLVVGTRQCKIPRAADTIHIVLCHHPPEWLRQWDRVASSPERAHLVLFGHEHTYSTGQIAPRRERSRLRWSRRTRLE